MGTLEVLCVGTRKDGTKCTAHPIKNSRYCIGHHEKAPEWRSKGGIASSDANRARAMMPEELRPLANELLETMEDLLQGRITPSQGSSFASLVNSLVKVIEIGVLETRISEMERAVNGHNETTK
tara:strand:+ start:358 stop:729 length:372 start_codon:yes stop_codon:yes gene_type:complete